MGLFAGDGLAKRGIPGMGSGKKNLPISTGTPAEFDCSSETRWGYSIRFDVEIQFCIAASAADAKTLMDAGACDLFTAGRYEFEVVGMTPNHLYFRSNGAAVTNGLMYTPIEAN